MKYASYAWLVIKNIIVLLIAFLLYSKANTSFEIIIVSLLLIIFTHAISSSSVLALGVWELSIKSSKQFLHILQILKRHDREYEGLKEIREKALLENKDYFSGIEKLYYEDEDTKEGMKEQEALHKELTIKSYITETFVFLIYALAVWKIIATLI
ncbi:MAG TPA: hypothetical protein P5056_04365 [Candidatus Paceibacterota bacterium]|jgi:hypothetical protein|nr:hypothetical protein [Candidatus Paceibacterota bacterium]